jgi:hypothetical protein
MFAVEAARMTDADTPAVPHVEVEAGSPDGNRRARGFLVLRERYVAVAAGVFALACLASLAIVSHVRNADGLATIALSLAILAFAIQIIVFAAQAQTAAQQSVQSEQLNADTRSLLSEVQTTARSTEAMVGEQFRELLRAFMGAASATAQEGGKFDPNELERRMMENVRREFGGSARTVASASARTRAEARGGPARTLPPESQPLLTFPDSPVEGESSLQFLENASPAAVRRLFALASDEIRNAGRPTSYVGLGRQPADAELREAELVHETRVRTQGAIRTVTRLTDQGRQIARLLTAVGDIPGWAEGRIPQVVQDDDDIPF